MRFNVTDHAQHPDFLTPHALFADRERKTHWAALLRPTGLAVYLAILNHAGYQSRTCYPSESLLARETGMDLRQVKREIKKLINFGMISKTTPKQKADLFDMPEREKQSNTYTILDATAWKIPNDYTPPEARADKGTRRKATPQMPLLPGDCESPDPVTVSHRPGDCESPDPVTVSHRPGDCESLGGCLSVTQNNRSENNRNEVTASTSTTTAAAISAEKDDDVDDDVATSINSIFKATKRSERITAQLVKQIVEIHGLQSAAEVLLAVKALASQAHIRSVIAVLKGKRTPSGYESGCFADGLCYLYAPDDTPQPQPTMRTQASQQKLSHEDAGKILAEVEMQLAAHKTQMSQADYMKAYDAAVGQRLASMGASVGAEA